MLKTFNINKRTVLCTGLVLLVACSGVAFAGAKGERVDTPNRYLARSLDGPLIQMHNTIDGSLWSAWAYRNGGEYDIAITVRHNDQAPWSEPLMIGANDGLDQRDPALAVDTDGTVYVAYADETANGSRINIATHVAGSNRWILRSDVVVGDALSSPELMVVGENLIVAYRDRQQVGLIRLPVISAEMNSGHSIYDGPDPTTSHEEEDGNTDGAGDMGGPHSDGEIIPITSDGPRSQRRSDGNR